MYEIIKSVINSGRYELTDILKKIDTLWVQGDLKEEQKTELVTLAQEKAKPENSFAPLQEQINKLASVQATLIEAVNKNASNISAIKEKLSESSIDVEEPTEEPTEEYPLYKQPTGAHDAYYNGDKMTYTDGFKYICIAPEGAPCVWSPTDYPAYWQKVEDEVEALN